MNQRKDSYRAALKREDDCATRPAKVVALRNRYVSVTIEVAPELRGELTKWVGAPVSAIVLTGSTVVRTLSAIVSRAPRSADAGT
jgi:hypothetical protein